MRRLEYGFLLRDGCNIMSTIINISVAAGDDDCRWHWTGSIWVFGKSDAYVQAGDRSATQYDDASAMRFLDVTVPSGATIVHAYLKLVSLAVRGTGWKTIVDGQLAPNPVTFSNMGDILTRSWTLASVVWNPAAWVVNTQYTSTDIASVIQEIIEQGGWNSGQSMVIRWSDGWGTGYQGDRRLWADAFEDASDTPAILSIEYDEGASGRSSPSVASRLLSGRFL